jgi:CubicO group peptidase (beta-lactamase class C family)
MKLGKWINIYKAGVLAATLIPGILFITIATIPALGNRETRPSIQVLQAIAPFSAFISTNDETRSSPDTIVERIDDFVSQQVNRHGIPGLALALVDDKQILFMKGYGKADQTGRSVTPETPFLLASVSKPLTAVAVMQLVEAGKVDLDAPVQRYIPEFTLADTSASRQITVRHLLLHTSGLPVTACDTRGHAGTLAEYVAELQKVEPAVPAGTRHIYCSGNYNLLGRVIETVSGQSFGQYIQEHVFAPLEMSQSFTSEALAQQAGMARGYQWFFGLPLPTHHPYNPSQLPSGYMISSAEDMGHFLISQLNEGQYMGTSMMSADTIAAMQVPGTERGSKGGYGFGWVIAPVGGVPAVWHDGVNANYHSLVLMLPEKRLGMVVLMNSFGIVAYESAYEEIETGITQLLAGIEPDRPSQSLRNLYLRIDAILAVILAMAVWPFARMRKWHRRLLQRAETGHPGLAGASLRSMIEISFALAFLVGIRTLIVTGLGGQSWYEVFTVFPDFVVWIWVLALVILLTGVIRAVLIVQIQRNRFAQTPQMRETELANRS